MTALWVALAADQRAHGSHVLGTESETAIRRSLSGRVVDDRAFVARGHDGIVGFVTVGIDEGPYQQDVRRGIVENVYVEDEYRGRGIGSALIERGERALAERGADVVTLEVLVANDDARRFYERLGYDDHRLELEKPLGSDTL